MELDDDDKFKLEVYLRANHRVDEETDCWNWIWYIDKKGYGYTQWYSRTIKVSRLAAKVWLGLTLSDSSVHVLHKCDNPRCINPEHLYLGNQLDNMRDKVNRGRHTSQKKTHCPYGHEYTKENTYLTSNGWRACKKCRRRVDNEYKERQKARKQVARNAI